MRDITNVNHLSPNKFSLVIDKFPNITWFAQRATLPGISFSPAQVPTNKKVDFSTTGDKLIFEDFIVGFILDENLNTFREIKDWMIANLGKSPKDICSDIVLTILSNNSKANINVKFYNAYPYTVGSTMMDTTQEELPVLSSDVYFRFSHYDILDIN